MTANNFKVEHFTRPEGYQTAVNPVLSAVDLSTSRTFTVPDGAILQGYTHLRVYAYYTYATAGDLSFAFDFSHPSASATRTTTQRQVLSSSTTFLEDGGIYKKTVSANDDFDFLVDIKGQSSVRCTVSHSAGTSSDLITVRISLYRYL